MDGRTRASGARYDRTLQALGPLRPLCNWRRGVLRRHSDGARWCRLRYPQEKPSTSAGPASGAKSRPGLRRSPGRPIFFKTALLRCTTVALRTTEHPDAVRSAEIRSVLVTGASGNLGRKLYRGHLLQRSWCERHRGDRPRGGGDAGLRQRQRTSPTDLRRSGTIAAGETRSRRSDAVVHLAAQNPSPLAPWDQFLPLLRHDRGTLAGAAGDAGVKRASSSPPRTTSWASTDPAPRRRHRPGRDWTTDREPGPRHALAGRRGDGAGHGLRGREADGRARLQRRGEPFGRHADLRQRPHRLVPAGREPAPRRSPPPAPRGRPALSPATANSERDLAWFRNMWLSNPRLPRPRWKPPSSPRAGRLAGPRHRRQRHVGQCRNGMGYRGDPPSSGL